MNIWRYIIKSPALFHFLAGMVLIIWAILLQNYFFNKMIKKKIKENFTNVLEKKENLLTAYLNILKLPDSSLSDSGKIERVRKFQDLYEEENISCYHFIGDSLVFWSTNAIPLPEDLIVKKQSSREIKRLQNGWYEMNLETDSSGIYIGLILLQHQYPFQNDFLQNSFQKDFMVPDGSNIIIDPQGGGLKTQRSQYSFDLNFPEKIPLSERNVFLLFLLFFAGFLFFLASIYFVYKQLKFVTTRKWLLICGFFLDVLLIRFLIFYFRIPGIVYDSAFFGPAYFSSSVLLPSLGDFFVDSILLLMISYILFLHLPASIPLKGKKYLHQDSDPLHPCLSFGWRIHSLFSSYQGTCHEFDNYSDTSEYFQFIILQHSRFYHYFCSFSLFFAYCNPFIRNVFCKKLWNRLGFTGYYCHDLPEPLQCSDRKRKEKTSGSQTQPGT